MTKKEQIFQYIESQPNQVARFTDIQRFIVDLKYGAGTYDNGKNLEDTYIFKNGRTENVVRMRNKWRGQFSSAFGGRGYLMNGPEFLVSVEGGYKVQRKSKI